MDPNSALPVVAASPSYLVPVYATYAVVAIDTDTTAVPYDTAMKMVRDNKVIMSPTKLAAAPKVKQSEWLDEAHTGWRSESDRYWGNTRTASKDEKKKPAER